ncbi:MAG: PQQ-binding-like beta-propeller repeat protein [Planctomycetota bacterium]
MSSLRGAGVLGLCVVLTSAVGAQEIGLWSQWRGPARTGVAPAPSWPASIDEEHLERQWRVELGPSYSGPVVDATTVYTTETVDEQREVVRALDRQTGEERWQTTWPGAMKVPFFAARNGSWIRATPALDDGALFVGGIQDVLACLDAETGAARWTVDFKEHFGTKDPAFGFVCSPIVVGDAVYVQAGGGFVKVAKDTGEVLWRVLDDDGGMASAFSSPAVGTLAGREQLLVLTRTELAGVDLDSGDVLWDYRVRAERDMNILTPIIFGNGVLTMPYGARATLVEITDDGEGHLTAEPAWTGRAQGYMTTPVVVGDHAYLLLRNQRFACVNLRSGETAWQSDPTGNAYWSLVVQGERILALADNGELLMIAADPKKFDVLERRHLSDSETWAHLAVDGGQLFVRELDGLSAFAW